MNPKNIMIMRHLCPVLAALILLGTTACNSSSKPKEANDSTQVATIAEDTAAAETAAPAELSEAALQEIQAKKDFLEKFYDGLDESGFDDAYIRKFITPNAKKILNEDFEFDCESGDCLAVWLFAYEGGGDTGKCLSRTIKEQDENHYLVDFKYEGNEVYHVLLTVIKDGDTYKIDDIKKQ